MSSPARLWGNTDFGSASPLRGGSCEPASRKQDAVRVWIRRTNHGLLTKQTQCLYLKHNLNAQAIASLNGQAISIQDDASRLIDQMNHAIARADEFVKTLK